MHIFPTSPVYLQFRQTHKSDVFFYSLFRAWEEASHSTPETAEEYYVHHVLLTGQKNDMMSRSDSFLPSSDTTLAGCNVCMWLSASRPPFRNNNKLPPLTHSVQFSGTRLTHANIHATESFGDGEMQHMPRHIKNKITYSSLLQSLPITPRRFHTNLIRDVESQAWVCMLSSHFAILVELWRFVNVVNKKLLLVDVSSYAKEAS